MTRAFLCLVAALVVGSTGLAGAVPAQTRQGAEAERLRRRVVLLEDRVAVLERQVAALEAALSVQREDALVTRPGPTYLELDRADGWRNPENWRLLRRGLGQLEVRYLLGAPGVTEASDLFTTWYYPDPRGGSVRFDALGGRVDSWSEPW